MGTLSLVFIAHDHAEYDDLDLAEALFNGCVGSLSASEPMLRSEAIDTGSKEDNIFS